MLPPRSKWLRCTSETGLSTIVCSSFISVLRTLLFFHNYNNSRSGYTLGSPKDSIQTKQKLVHVAGMMFSEHGYNQVTVRDIIEAANANLGCLLYTSPSPRDGLLSRMPSSA